MKIFLIFLCRSITHLPPPVYERPPLQGVSGVEDAAEDPVGGGAEGDQEAEERVDGPGPNGR